MRKLDVTLATLKRSPVTDLHVDREIIESAAAKLVDLTSFTALKICDRRPVCRDRYERARTKDREEERERDTASFRGNLR